MTTRSDFVIVSNRLPVHRIRRGRSYEWKTSPGGLVSALKPILARRPSSWIGWPGFPGKAPEPFEHDGIRNHPVRLTESEVETFYEGFSNRTLWPLYHDAVRTPEYHRRWWWPYVEVNERFAEAAAELVTDDGIVWVHDYHLQLVPRMIRELKPNVRIGFFLHIPFPPQELFAQLPWRRAILEGLLGADVVGFQTAMGVHNFVQLSRRFTPAHGSRETLHYEDRAILARSFPISIDYEKYRGLAQTSEVKDQMEVHRSLLGPERRILLGVDRLDYTKGIDIRIRAFGEALRTGQVSVDDVCLVQVAVPSRERVEQYRELRSRVERLVGEINGEFGKIGKPAIHYLHRSLPADELVALYGIADVLLVTPLRDGMNLVAKEYVAARVDKRGVLVLSEFTGSATELNAAVLVNPHDIDGLALTIENALQMPVEEQKRRMQIMQRKVRKNDVYHWADSFLEALQG